MRKHEKPSFEKPTEEKNPSPQTEARQETIEEESFSRVCEKIKESVRRGECGYVVMTKLKPGSTFRGTEVGRDISDFHDFQDFIVGPPKVPERLLREKCMWEQPLSCIGDWDKEGNAAMVAFYVGIKEDSGKTERVETRSRLGIKKTEEIPIWTTRRATLRDFGLQGEDELCYFSISYIVDRSQLADKRQNPTTINFLMSKDNINKLLRAIRSDPENFWNFIRSIEPELLDAAPPAKKSDDDGEGLVFYKIEEPIPIAEMSRKLRSDTEPFAILDWPEQ